MAWLLLVLTCQTRMPLSFLNVGIEIDLLVIMLSVHGDTKLVRKGITHGTCDYLLKLVRIEKEDEDPSIQEKPRVVGSVEVHRKCVSAVSQLGLDSEFYVV
ncbi:hypothetical protein Goarm_001038 [Gossypium armourianum]|uniref:Uncharacterized protein n=1 Tax=Gossypium armourianum TaxID=34283 RepID=A0A7J9KCA3_9ROSI|nr:hypothetical protein [Gossypium armourianum]